MKQIVPFKKELPFKTKVSEITSISLEREINVLEDAVITGVFHITGDYKMNEGSINREEFSFDLPFDITLDPRYDIDSVKSDIEDFYYDVINEDTVKVNIDLYIEAEYKEETPLVVEEEQEEVRTTAEEIPLKNIPIQTISGTLEKEEKIMENIKEEDVVENTKEEKITSSTTKEERDDDGITASDLFSNLDDTETYSTYYVYIVKEEDTIDKILVKYGITKEELESYNDITGIKPGDKVIIPKASE